MNDLVILSAMSQKRSDASPNPGYNMYITLDSDIFKLL